MAAFERLLGKSEDVVGHAMIPLHLGADVGGSADIVYFKQHLPGIIAVTSDWIGCAAQVANQLGTYELMICQRDDVAWGANIIARLASYTLHTALDADHTMDIGPATPDGSTITAFLFLAYAQFEVRGRQAGLLLCLGITEDELEACHEGRQAEVVAALKCAGIYPFTDLFRKSVSLS